MTVIFDQDFAEVDEPLVILSLPKGQAEKLSDAMSDLLCWHRGYAAGKGEDTSNSPMGVEDLREFRIALNKAITDAEPVIELPLKGQ